MKYVFIAGLFAALASGAYADPIEGLWQTEPDDGAFAYVDIAPCGQYFCGTITRTFKAGAEYASKNIGKQIVQDMAAQGGGKYRGKVFRPSNGKTYTGKITVQGKAMAMSGCVAGGLICAKQNWVKIQ
ncbi:imidazoleglycerol-phosphate dehydratase [Thioclava sp. SK-1]|uniref:DUF2147 domain-containing protein n=1 Tax=Thioclava sp. SK-1 TaxID=1889770 RepID=UPI00082567F5|nr:DUF2147 domain-containing protein [Thioclava sp. SK-1]OCX62824.1 imidazoleglycerol-phosphate dehydratase [Thioclava sp. SK-1]